MQSKKVLIVEDEALIAMELQHRLSSLGYAAVSSVTTADDAVRATEEHAPDIVLMDIHLRGERDGISAAREISERFCLPVVFLTAYADEATIDRARETKPFGFLVKPYREEDLRFAIEIAFIKHRTEQELRQAKDELEHKVRERTGDLSRTIEELQREIRERKETEAALRESEAKFRCLFDCANDGILIADAATRKFVEANPAMCSMLGYTRDELLRLSVDDVHPPLDAPLVIREFRNAVERGNTLATNLPLMRKDGSVFYADVGHATVLLNGKAHAMGIFRDTTERRRAEEIIQVRLRLTEYAATHRLEDLLQKTLDEVGALTDSPLGFYHFVEHDQQTLSLQAWSTRTVQAFCTAEGKRRHYRIPEAGVWGDCIRQRKPVIHNDYRSLPRRKGLPPGHAALIRILVVPVFRDDKIVAILGVGNKPREYTNKDVELVMFLADVAWEITGRKRAEEELRAANDRFSFLISTSPAVIYTCRYGGDWAATFMSENLKEVLGYSAEENLTSPGFWADRIHPDDRERVFAGLSALETGDFHTHEYRFMHRDGAYRWMFDRLRVVRGERGTPVECVGSWMDITDRKNAEERLLLLHKAVSTSRAGITFRDVNNRIVFTNSAEARMHGYDTDELIGRPAHMLSLPKRRRDLSIEKLNTIAGWERESMNVRKDGTLFPVHLASEIVKDESGIPLGIVSVCEDITDRKRIENELKVYEQIVNRMAEGIILTRTTDKLIVYVNPAFERMFGYAQGEMAGMEVTALNAGGTESPEEAAARIQHALRTDGSWSGTLRNKKKDGSVFWCHASVATFSHPRYGEVWLGVQQDITARINAEQALEATSRLLESVFDSTHVQFAYLDPQFYFISVNWAYAIADNREPSFYPGRNLFEFHPDAGNEATFRKVLQTGEPFFVRARPFRYAGQEERENSYWDWSLVPIKDQDDVILGLVLSLVDVTESVRMRTELEQHRQRLEVIVNERTQKLQDTIGRLNDEISERTKLTEELHRSKLFLTNILNSIQDGICVLDSNRKIMLMNKSIANWVPEASQVGFRTHTCGDLFHNLGRCDGCIAHSGANAGGQRAMIFPGGDDRDKKWFDIHSFPLSAEDGTIIGCVEYIRDVTAAKEMEGRILQYQEQLRMLNYEMAATRYREQRRIAQELHDSIPQALVFCRLQLESMERHISAMTPIADQSAKFQEIYQLLDNSIEEARSLIFQLAPPVLYELGLKPALQQLIERFAKTYSIDIRFKGRGLRTPIRGEGAAILYGMVRELLVNCIKHSGANAVDVSVSRRAENLIITVEDNGRGFDQRKTKERLRTEGGGFGLFSISERLQLMDGEFLIRGGTVPGACATIRVPLSRLQNAAGVPKQALEDL